MCWKSKLLAIQPRSCPWSTRLPTSWWVTRAKVVLPWSRQSLLANRGVSLSLSRPDWKLFVVEHDASFGRRLSSMNIIISHKDNINLHFPTNYTYFRYSKRRLGSPSLSRAYIHLVLPAYIDHLTYICELHLVYCIILWCGPFSTKESQL